jgi:hypothetical protein
LAASGRGLFRYVPTGGFGAIRLLNQWEDERKAWLRIHPEPWITEIEREYHQRFSGTIERWLDAGYGACLLRQPNCGTVIAKPCSILKGSASS